MTSLNCQCGDKHLGGGSKKERKYVPELEPAGEPAQHCSSFVSAQDK